jgi:hypothetical protein
MYGKAVKFRHCPATVIAESRAVFPPGFLLEKGAQAQRRESQETDQTPIYLAIPASMGGLDSF